MKRHSYLSILTIASLVLMGALVGAQSVSYDFDRAANFAAFKTYSWVRGTELTDRLNHNRVVGAIDTQLASRGFTKLPDAAPADVLVAYHASFDKNLRINGFSNGWGPYRLGGFCEGTVTTEDILMGTLIVDMVQANTKTIIWRGTAVGEVNPKLSPEKRDKKINSAVEKIFKNYPPKGSKQES
jgi:Domain of unknown function (DUF4136)